MADRVLVSVVMAVYNGADLIGQSIASVLAQSHDSLELLIVDDGSVDSTVAVVRDWARRDARVKLVRRDHGGQASALNAGVGQAQGAYIARIDHDDLWHPRRLELQIPWLDREELAVGGSWVRKIGDGRGLMRFPTGHQAMRYEALFTCPILDSATLFRGDVLRENPYPSSAIVRQEMVQLVRLLPRYRFGSLPVALTDYRLHRDQKTRRVAPLIAYRQRQLEEQWFAKLCPEASGQDKALFSLMRTSEAIDTEALDQIADLFIRLLKPDDAEARAFLLRHWRLIAARHPEPRASHAIRDRVEAAFLL